MNVLGIRNYQRNQQQGPQNPNFGALGAKSIKFPKEVQYALRNELVDIKTTEKLAEKFLLGIDENGHYISYRFAGADEASYMDVYKHAQSHEPSFNYSIIEDSIARADIERYKNKFSATV